MLAVVLPVMAGFLIMGRIGLRWFRGLARWSRTSVLRRIAAATLSAVVLTMLFWAWWPQPGTYRPIQPNERGLITELLPSAQHVDRVSPAASRPGFLPVGASAERRLADGAPLEATFQKGQALPSKAHPQLAMVLVPRQDAHDGQPGTPTANRRPSPGSSRSTSRCRPRRATTRRRRSTPPMTR